MPELVIQLTRAGFLALLWLFVLAALRVVRSDLFSASGMRVSMPGSDKSGSGKSGSGKLGGRKKQPKQPRGRNKAPRNLVVTHGALAGTRISLDGRPILIGRADDSTLVLDDDYASTRHARLSLRGNTWYVEDLGSTNGTYLDRAKVTGPTEVRLGVPIRIGKTVIELRS
ncbi:FHA domain-containing protein FhaB/FipA [Bounagaea algeriensis]